MVQDLFISSLNVSTMVPVMRIMVLKGKAKGYSHLRFSFHQLFFYLLYYLYSFWTLVTLVIKVNLMHESPTIAWSSEGNMYASLLNFFHQYPS